MPLRQALYLCLYGILLLYSRWPSLERARNPRVSEQLLLSPSASCMLGELAGLQIKGPSISFLKVYVLGPEFCYRTSLGCGSTVLRWVQLSLRRAKTAQPVLVSMHQLLGNLGVEITWLGHPCKHSTPPPPDSRLIRCLLHFDIQAQEDFLFPGTGPWESCSPT